MSFDELKRTILCNGLERSDGDWTQEEVAENHRKNTDYFKVMRGEGDIENILPVVADQENEL